MPVALYMVVEQFKNKNPLPVYKRYRAKGRMMPEGVEYVASWVEEDMGRCYQVMRAESRKLLDQWLSNWRDIVDFEVYGVITSQEAADRVRPLMLDEEAPKR
jgi:hypothetical protein